MIATIFWVLLLVALWPAWRFYKMIGRRCNQIIEIEVVDNDLISLFQVDRKKTISRECGCIWVKRRSKIYLGEGQPEPTIEIRDFHWWVSKKNIKSIFHWAASIVRANGKWRWWIRRVSTETFTDCPDCKTIMLVNNSTRSISVWHVLSKVITDPEQFRDDAKLNTISFLTKKDWQTGKHLLQNVNSVRTDTPPIRIWSQ